MTRLQRILGKVQEHWTVIGEYQTTNSASALASRWRRQHEDYEFKVTGNVILARQRSLTATH